MLLEKLSNARGVSGNETEVREILIDAIQDRVDTWRADTMGNLIALKKAKGARGSFLTRGYCEGGFVAAQSILRDNGHRVRTIACLRH